MEGMPKVPMITPDLKTTEQMPPDLVPKLREYILIHFNDDPTKFNNAFHELQTMRKSVSGLIVDTEAILVMQRYFAQMSMMKSRFPMEAGEACSVSFDWSDRSIDGCQHVVYNDVNYELCCIMYNIGASHANIGVNETRSDADSIKHAFMQFQSAAWPFKQLREELKAHRFTSAGFDTDLMSFYYQILLAQAQECVIERSLLQHRTHKTVAKLANYASDAYFELKVLLEHSTIPEIVSSSKVKSWKNLCMVKGNLYAAIGQLRVGQLACEENKFGERLAHFNAALSFINEAQAVVKKDKSESLKQCIAFASDVITKEQASAQKDNEFIYHDKVPKAEDLQVESVSLAKPIGFDPCARDVCGPDLFGALLPADTLKGVSLYSEEKAALKRKIIEKIEKKDNELDSHLMSLQLNQVNLDQPTDEMRLPDQLLQCSAGFTSQPHAFSDLLDKLNGVAERSNEAQEKLTELSRRLEDVKCPQLEDDEGFKAISSKVQELSAHQEQARRNNRELQTVLASQSEHLKLLGMPLAELAKHICNKVVNVADTSEVLALRKILDKVDEMKRQRMALFESLRIDLENDDITSKILSEKDFSVQVLFDNELRKHDRSIQLIDMNLAAQDNILKALTEANANFAETRRDIVENNANRMAQSMALVTAYEIFDGVKEKTEAAINFYNQLSSLLKTLDKSIVAMESVFTGMRERHEQQQRIIAERTKLYRESRAAVDACGILTGEPSVQAKPPRRRLADYLKNNQDGSRPKLSAVPQMPASTPYYSGNGPTPNAPSPMPMHPSPVNSMPPMSAEQLLNRQDSQGVSQPTVSAIPQVPASTHYYSGNGSASSSVASTPIQPAPFHPMPIPNSMQQPSYPGNHSAPQPTVSAIPQLPTSMPFYPTNGPTATSGVPMPVRPAPIHSVPVPSSEQQPIRQDGQNTPQPTISATPHVPALTPYYPANVPSSNSFMPVRPAPVHSMSISSVEQQSNEHGGQSVPPAPSATSHMSTSTPYYSVNGQATTSMSVPSSMQSLAYQNNQNVPRPMVSATPQMPTSTVYYSTNGSAASLATTQPVHPAPIHSMPVPYTEQQSIRQDDQSVPRSTFSASPQVPASTQYYPVNGSVSNSMAFTSAQPAPLHPMPVSTPMPQQSYQGNHSAPQPTVSSISQLPTSMPFYSSTGPTATSGVPMPVRPAPIHSVPVPSSEQQPIRQDEQNTPRPTISAAPQVPASTPYGSGNGSTPNTPSPMPVASTIKPSPFANFIKVSSSNNTSPWHQGLHLFGGAQSTYVSPFQKRNGQPSLNPTSVTSVPTMLPMNSVTQQQSPVANRGPTGSTDPTAALLDNLFEINSAPHDFSKQQSHNVGRSQGNHPSTTNPGEPLLCRPAATVLPMRRPDGTWPTSESDSNAILSFTNVHSVSVSEGPDDGLGRTGAD